MKRVSMILALSLLLTVSVQAGISDPGDIGGLYLRLEADSLGAADGDSITSWTDSASGYEFTGSATYDADYANGHGALYFDGIGDQLKNRSFVDAPNTGNLTVFIVANFTTAGNDGITDYLISAQYPDGATNNRLRITKYKDDIGRYQFRVGGGTNITLSQTADTEQHVFALVSGQTSNSVDFMIDGEVLGSSDTGGINAVALQALGLGSSQNGDGGLGNSFAGCSIAEVLLYDHALTAEQVSDVTGYLQAKYVPEPATMILLGLGGLMGLRRRK